MITQNKHGTNTTGKIAEHGSIFFISFQLHKHYTVWIILRLLFNQNEGIPMNFPSFMEWNSLIVILISNNFRSGLLDE